MIFPTVKDVIDNFKRHCLKKPWAAYGDVIKTEKEYHKLIWKHHPYPHTFKYVVTAPICAIREGYYYKTVTPAYLAWVLSESPSTEMWRLLKESPKLIKKAAFYDLSRFYKGEPTCLKINETKSKVLKEFERFLKAEYKIKLVSFPNMSKKRNKTLSSTQIY